MSAAKNHPWERSGPGRETREVDRALERLNTAANRPPTAADAPRLSLLPMTRAAREALRLTRGKAKG